MKNGVKKRIILLMVAVMACLSVEMPVSARGKYKINPPTLTVSKDNSEYGTPLKDIISLEGGSISLKGKEIQGAFTLAEPEKIYDAGNHKKEKIKLLFNSSDKVYTDYPVTVKASFVITKRPITVTVEYDVRKYKQDNPPFEYKISEGTLADADSMNDLFDGPICEATSESSVGEYEITFVPKKKAANYDVTIISDILTIEPATVISFSDDEPFAENDYWRTIFANSEYNSEEGLISFLTKEKASYKALHGQDTLDLISVWSAGSDNVPFDPKGRGMEEAYSYTASLTMEEADAKNYEIEIESPKAYVRVIPVNAVQMLDTDSATLAAADVKALPDGCDVEEMLGLPKTAAVTYVLDEMYKGADQYENDKFQGGSDTYAIDGWKMEDGQDLTPEALRAKAESVGDGQEVEVMLTPVYATTGDNAVPVWATLEEAPKFTLIVTEKIPVAVIVAPPANLTYGDRKLQDPRAAQEAVGGNGIDEKGVFAYRYVGVEETKYDSEVKPTDAGKYRVVAVLESETHSGRGISETFVISPRPVTVSGITGQDKVYDGNTDVELDTQNARIKGMIDGDELYVTASGYFDGKQVGLNKTVVIIDITLTGASAGNYTIAEKGNQTRTKATITHRPLTIDDSEVMVTKEYDGTVKPGTLKGALKPIGVIDGDKASFTGKVVVGSYADPDAGKNKTVKLSGIKLTGSDAANYSYEDKKESARWTYTFNKAEINAKPYPVLGTHFTVTIPKRSPYDGNLREATVTPMDGVTGLGAVTVTYAKQKADGETYDDPTTVKPEDAGTYKVIVSFEEGDAFASMEGKNAIEAGIFTIKKAASASATADVTVPVVAARTVQLSELGLRHSVGQGAKIKNKLSATDSKAKVMGEVGKTFFTLERKQTEGGEPLSFELVLRSDNYVKVTVATTVTIAKFAIDKASIEPFATDGYYIMIYANSEDNANAEALKNFVTEKKGTYTAHYDDNRVVELAANWSADDDEPFDPKGKKDGVWYLYIATLTAQGDFDPEIFTTSSNITNPKAYVRVIPVNATQTLAANSAALMGTDVKDLANERDLMDMCGLPQKAAVAYAPAEYSKEIIEQAGEFSDTAGEFTISGWELDGVPLTLSALQAKVDSAIEGDLEVALTPVYAADTVPAWATLEEPPKFTLIITGSGEVETAPSVLEKPVVITVVAVVVLVAVAAVLVLCMLRLPLKKKKKK